MTFSREKSRRPAAAAAVKRDDDGDDDVALTGALVDGGVDHGAELREAGLPHDVRWALHPFGRWYR